MLVVFGWPILGLLLESYGFLVLFRWVFFFLGVFFSLTTLWSYQHSFPVLICLLMSFLHSSVMLSGFWPTLAVFLQKIPLLGWLLQQQYIRSVNFSTLNSTFLTFLTYLIELLLIFVIESVAGSLPWKVCSCLNPLCTEIHICYKRLSMIHRYICI